MCVILYKEKSVNIDLNTLEDIIDANPDGLGYSFWDKKDNSWNTIKLLDPKKKELKEAVKNMEGTEAVIHARIATSGGVTLTNVHPFIGKKYTLFHNGVVCSLNGVLDKYSDTRLLHKLLEQFNLKEASELLKNIAHNSNSKFVLIDNSTGKVHRFGKFQDYKGLHCSNLYFVYTYSNYWFKTPNKPVNIINNNLDTLLSQDIKNKLKEKYDIQDVEDYQVIVEELEYNKLPITWENVQGIADYLYGYTDYEDSLYNYY